ncbi:hypothetical protein NDU88_002856 [Pleurodeles waltl]|uniref:Uncharacterized protein n=1 Tax=Pleurodeles waltl TaxID=8319 RepID=A0AAV7MNY1_PLEWA|nr:hypothetical protein NDU88_002856 [Pleurodeles waltl]
MSPAGGAGRGRRRCSPGRVLPLSWTGRRSAIWAAAGPGLTRRGLVAGRGLSACSERRAPGARERAGGLTGSWIRPGPQWDLRPCGLSGPADPVALALLAALALRWA